MNAFDGETVFLTGATGFIGRVVLGRLLATSPNIACVYVLLRDKRLAAAERFAALLESEALRDVRELAGERVRLIRGDAFNVGVIGARADMQCVCESTTVIINCVGTVNFREHIQAAIRHNVLTAANLIEFAQRVRHLKAFVHMSTAYVNSDRGGVIGEAESLPALPGIDAELLMKKVMLMAPTAAVESEASIIGRYPNCHMFGKALAERIVDCRRESIPVVLLRPTLIGAALRHPAPGWVSSNNSLATLVMLSGVGLMQREVVRGEAIVDVIPVDFVANAALVAAASLVAAAATRRCDNTIRAMHVSSSATNPLRWEQARRFMSAYWRRHPPRRAVAPPRLKFHSNELTYRLWFFANYDVPSAASWLSAKVVPTAANRRRAQNIRRSNDALSTVHYTFRTWTQVEWIFEQSELPRVLCELFGSNAAQCAVDSGGDDDDDVDDEFAAACKELQCDARAIDWRMYIALVCYGVRRYVLRESDVAQPIDLMVGSLLSKHLESSPRASFIERLCSDIVWAWRVYPRPEYAVRANGQNGGVVRGPREPDEMKARVLATPRVADAIAAHPKGVYEGRKAASLILDQMGHTLTIGVCRVAAYFLRKIFRSLYSSIHVDEAGVAELRKAVANGAVALIPTHRSYVDFLIVSFLCLECNVPLPHIAAGEDFLAVMFVNWIFRNAGAFFIRRSFKNDPLYWEVFAAYVQQLALDRLPIEFFIEGTRSRSGKTLFPKLGMIGLLVEPCLNGRMDDLTIAPIAISYDKVLEAELYSYELLGDPKPRESFQNLLKARRVLSQDFGRINLTFGKHLSVAQFKRDYYAARHELPPTVERRDQPAPKPLVRALACEVVGRLQRALVVTPTALVSALLLVYRRGVERRQLERMVAWLRQACEERGATVAHEGSAASIVKHGFAMLQNLVVEIRGEMLQPLMVDEDGKFDCKPTIVLAVYRNQLIHLFYVDGVLAIVLNSFQGAPASRADVMQRVDFLRQLWMNEFPTSVCPCPLRVFDAALAALVTKGIVDEFDNGAQMQVSKPGQGHVTFLCHMFWPFVDSYWVAALSLTALAPNGSATKKSMLARMSYMAEQLYAERKARFGESCSLDVLGNAFNTFQQMGIVERSQTSANIVKLLGQVSEYRLCSKYSDGSELQTLVNKLAQFRHMKTVKEGSMLAAMGADFPILAKL